MLRDAPRVLLVVIAVGFAVLVGDVVALADGIALSGEIWVLVALVIGADLVPIVPTVQRRGQTTVAGAYAFALVFVAGGPEAAAAMAIGSLASDIINQPGQPLRWAYNVAQYTIGLTLAGLIAGSYDGSLLAGSGPLVMVGAGLAFFATSHLLVSLALATVDRVSPARVAWEELPTMASDAIPLLMMGGLIAAAGIRVETIPLLVLPLAWLLGRRRLQEEGDRGFFDELTGLPARALLEDRAAQALRAATRDGLSVTVAVVDLDDFKAVNDTHGHAVGDELLQAVADRLRGGVRSVDTIARTGGDEFVALLLGVRDGTAEEDVVAKLVGAVERPVQLSSGAFVPRVSVGAARSPEDGDQLPALLAAADAAMYAVKRARVRA